jgi:hypothetical protein
MSSLFCHSNFVVVGLRRLLEALSFSASEEYEFENPSTHLLHIYECGSVMEKEKNIASHSSNFCA